MLMKKLVIPVITDEWEKVAIFLEYSIEEKNNIKGTYRYVSDVGTYVYVRISDQVWEN